MDNNVRDFLTEEQIDNGEDEMGVAWLAAVRESNALASECRQVVAHVLTR